MILQKNVLIITLAVVLGNCKRFLKESPENSYKNKCFMVAINV